MASFEFNMPEEFQKELSKHLSKIDDVAPKMLEEAAPIVVNKLKKKAPVSTGKMRDGIKAKKATKTKNGSYVLPIVFTGSETKTTKDGKKTKVPNAVKAAVAEYGKSGQEAKPFIRSTIKESEQSVIEKMQEVFIREVGTE